MRIWNQVRSALRKWWPGRTTPTEDPATQQDRFFLAAGLNLQTLLEDTQIPSAVRAELEDEFHQIEEFARKLEQEEIHIAVYGRVGVGKSSLLNALLGSPEFTTSPLHGETRRESRAEWQQMESGHLMLIDTPGIDELDGEERGRLARKVSSRADVVIMVCDGDLTQLEREALDELTPKGRTVLLVLNKSDRYSESELTLLLDRLRERTSGILPANQVIACASDPRPDTVLVTGADGTETEQQRPRKPDVEGLRLLLWDLLEKDGKSLSALNASLFTQELDQKIASRIVEARKSVAEALIRKYCLLKGLAVAVNPVPVADLLAAAGTDIAMIIHLGEIYGFRMDRKEASRLLLTISAQWIALMGAYWGVNLVSSALKTVSVGMSAVLTASAQGGLAWYATYLTGKMAQNWFSRGKSWGPAGPRQVADELLASLDRNAMLENSIAEIRQRVTARSKVSS